MSKNSIFKKELQIQDEIAYSIKIANSPVGIANALSSQRHFRSFLKILQNFEFLNAQIVQISPSPFVVPNYNF